MHSLGSFSCDSKIIGGRLFSSQLIGFRSEVHPFNYNLTHLDIIINHHESSMSQI